MEEDPSTKRDYDSTIISSTSLSAMEYSHMLRYFILIYRRYLKMNMEDGLVKTQCGYDSGYTPPVRCSSPFGIINCTKGDSTYGPYLVAHHLLLAHTSAVKMYREKYKPMQDGFVGVDLFAYWFEPYTNTLEDVEATQRANDFYLGWFLNPLVNGDYPDIMKKNAGNQIPSFTKLESEMIKGSFDFFGINHYNTLHVKDNPASLETDIRDFSADMAATLIYNGSLITPTELPVAPLGLQKLLNYLKEEYGNPPIYIHENGIIWIN